MMDRSGSRIVTRLMDYEHSTTSPFHSFYFRSGGTRLLTSEDGWEEQDVTDEDEFLEEILRRIGSFQNIVRSVGATTKLPETSGISGSELGLRNRVLLSVDGGKRAHVTIMRPA